MYTVTEKKKPSNIITIAPLKNRIHFAGKGRATTHNHTKGRTNQRLRRELNDA